MCKTSASQISMVENGDSRASLRTSIALADALGTSIEYLVERVDDPRPMQEIVTELKTKAARVRDLEAGHAERLDPECADYVGVNEIDATVGAGATSTDGVFKRRHRFPHPWVREHGLKADLCRIIQDGSNPAICGHRKSGHFGVPRRELSFTSRHPVFARLSGSWCASSAARTSARARDGAGGRATR